MVLLVIISNSSTHFVATQAKPLFLTDSWLESVVPEFFDGCLNLQALTFRMLAEANRRSGLGRLAELSARKLQKYYPKWPHLRQNICFSVQKPISNNCRCQ